VGPEQAIAVGDSMEHDIAGAEGAGCASVLVCGGIHAEELGMLVGPGRYCSQHVDTQCEPSCIEFLAPFLAPFNSPGEWHSMMWRAIYIRPWMQALAAGEVGDGSGVAAPAPEAVNKLAAAHGAVPEYAVPVFRW
jgi:hypothetical protein